MIQFNFRPGVIGAAVVSIMLSFSACSVINPGMRAWEGHSIDDLIRSWGQPDSTQTFGSGIEAYTWTLKNEDCEQTFTVRDRKIIGTSDTNCSG